jgi:hypothetical protein
MRTPKPWSALVGATALCAAVAVAAGAALADDKKPSDAGPPPPLKAIKHPFVDCFLGDWTHEASMSGNPSRGRASFRLSVGGTALLQDYETGAPEMKAPDFWGHAVVRVSADGKSMTTWWFDNHSDEPMVFKGTLTEKSSDSTAKTPQGDMRMTWEKTADGLLMKMYQGGELFLTDVYKPSPR